MEDYRLEQTGQEVQRILNGAAMQVDLNTEVERATDAEGTLQENIDAEAQARQDADGLLQQGISDEETRAKRAEEANAGEIEGIKALIPSTASEVNKLADTDFVNAEAQARQDADGLLQQGISDEETRAKRAEEANAGEIEGIKALIPSTATSANKLADTNYVNSSIQTATAEYRGDYNVVTDLHLAIDATHAQIETLLPTVIAEADKNDYCYVMIPTNAQTPTEIAKIERYKMTSEGWKFEYDVNNSTFTAEEWAAIKSGITSGLVAKLNALPTNADLLLLLAGKQDVLTFDSVPVPESNNPVKSGGVYSAIDDEKTARLNSDTAIHAELDGLQAKVPATASSDNKLVDQNQMNSSISTATATYRGDWNVVSDLHLAVDATRAQIAALLPTVISTADNNDYCYVEIPTSADTPTQIERVERYKFNGTAWGYEYTLNNSGFTADQWAAINSMITSGLVAKLSALPTNADLLAMFAQKQDNLTFDSTPTENSTNPVTSGGVFAADKALSDAIEAILLLIPSAASALNKLVDTALMNSSISTATATFRGTYNLVSGLHLDIDATEGQIAAALLANISTADNNDYAFVQIPTSAETPAQIARTDRYKFNGTAWGYEYTLNTSGFTAAQWAAINSGVTDTLVAELANIANLIPSEASQYNKLADKVYVITQIIAHIADFKGEYGTLLELQSVLNPKPGDLGIVRTKDNDGKDVYTFYQYKDSLWNEYYTLSYHPQIKPATTGTTGDYPYNGMGRVELPMNMVNGVNTLTQDMFYKGAQGFREPNTNTIFVIRYDFTLGEDITVPANCMLEFDGGSISNSSGNTYSIKGIFSINDVKYQIFKNVTFVIDESIICTDYIRPEWFGARGDFDPVNQQGTDDSAAINAAILAAEILNVGKVKFCSTNYYISSGIHITHGNIWLDGVRAYSREDVPASIVSVLPSAGSSLWCNNGTSVITIDSGVANPFKCTNLQFLNIGFTSGSQTSIAIDYKAGLWSFVVENCHFDGFDKAIYFNNPNDDYIVYHPFINENSFVNNKWCVLFEEIEGPFNYPEITKIHTNLTWDFEFCKNQCHHNGRILKVCVLYGRCIVTDNNMEGNRAIDSDTVSAQNYIITGGEVTLDFSRNYFEDNTIPFLHLETLFAVTNLRAYGNVKSNVSSTTAKTFVVSAPKGSSKTLIIDECDTYLLFDNANQIIVQSEEPLSSFDVINTEYITFAHNKPYVSSASKEQDINERHWQNESNATDYRFCGQDLVSKYPQNTRGSGRVIFVNEGNDEGDSRTVLVAFLHIPHRLADPNSSFFNFNGGGDQIQILDSGYIKYPYIYVVVFQNNYYNTTGYTCTQLVNNNYYKEFGFVYKTATVGQKLPLNLMNNLMGKNNVCYTLTTLTNVGNIAIGNKVFNRDDDKEYTWNGSAWVDATGTPA